jgi:hypothetical protein
VTEAQALEAVDELFAANWPTLSAAIAANPALPSAYTSTGVPYALDNEGIAVTDYFALCTLVHTTRQQITVGQTGTRRTESRGYIMVKLWSPADTGRMNQALLAGCARSIFDGVNVSSPVPGDEPMVVNAGATAELGSDGRWFMQVIKFPFRYYAIV